MRLSIDAMLEHGDMAGGSDHRDILETYRMFANDRGWVHRLTEAIENGLSAEAAVVEARREGRRRAGSWWIADWPLSGGGGDRRKPPFVQVAG